MRPRTPRIGRRAFAVTLAYLLALQVILTAWAVLAPANATRGVQGIICTTHASDPAQRSDRPATPCPCGPMCHAGASPVPGAPPETVSIALLHFAAALVVWQARWFDEKPNTSTHPGKARAPPITV